jgi:hypothetical protein
MSPFRRPRTYEPRDRTLLTLGIVMVVMLVALLAMPFIVRTRGDIPPRGMTSHSAASAV